MLCSHLFLLIPLKSLQKVVMQVYYFTFGKLIEILCVLLISMDKAEGEKAIVL